MRKEKVFSVSVEGVTSVQQMTVDVLCCPMRREMLHDRSFWVQFIETSNRAINIGVEIEILRCFSDQKVTILVYIYM